LCLYSVRLEGRFEDKKEFEFEIQCQHDEVRSLASELREKTNGLLDPKVETDYRTTALLVSHENFWEYAQTLGHDFSRIRVRWETGSQYRAQLHYLDRDPTEERWGVMIVPNDSPLTKRNINFPLPRKPRKGSLNDPEKAFLVEKVGDFTPQVKIYLVK
jgi:hypothetical protein